MVAWCGAHGYLTHQSTKHMQVLDELHDGYLGVAKMEALARGTYGGQE